MFLNNKSNDIDKQWKDIYGYIKTMKTEDINEFQLDSISDKLSRVCNIFEAESILLCKNIMLFYFVMICFWKE